MSSPPHRGLASSARTRSTALTLTTMRRLEVLARVEPEVLVRRPREAVRAGVRAAAVDVDGVVERQRAAGAQRADDAPRAHVQVLDRAQLAPAGDVVEREQGRLPAVVVGEAPAEGGRGAAHGATIPNMCSGGSEPPTAFSSERALPSSRTGVVRGSSSRIDGVQEEPPSARWYPRRRAALRRPLRRRRCRRPGAARVDAGALVRRAAGRGAGRGRRRRRERAARRSTTPPATSG